MRPVTVTPVRCKLDDSATVLYRANAGEVPVFKTNRVWQEYFCHLSGIEFDRVNDDLLTRGQRFECPGCLGWHMAGVDGPSQTYVARPDGELESRSLPADALERRAWLVEAASWNEDPR